MLQPQERAFIEYWEQNRDKKKRVIRQLSLGLPLAVVLVLAIFVNFFSGWYKRADMMIQADPSIIIVLIIAAIGIVVFIVIFSVRHQWDQNEQRYRELKARDEPGQPL